MLKLKGKSLSDYANYLGVARQQISNKKNSDSFTADDLIKLADFTDTSLTFADNKGHRLITFDDEDLSKKK